MPGLVAPPVALTGFVKHEWVDPGGTLRDLTYQTSPNLYVSRGATGLGMPPVQISDEKLPFQGGSVVRHIGVPPAEMVIPVTVLSTSMANLVATMDDLRQWFDTGDERTLRPGYYRVTREDGTVRQRRCYYRGGLEGSLQEGGPTGVTLAVQLYAPDGWPTDAADTTYSWGQASYGGAVGVMNAGQLEAYPVWQVRGPGVGIIINNLTAGVALGWNGALSGAETLTLDTRPTSQRTTTLNVYDQAGANRYSSLVATSALWHLVPGLNQIEISMTGATGATLVSLAYRQRYRGALR